MGYAAAVLGRARARKTWLRADVADAHTAAGLDALTHHQDVEPYRLALEALATVPAGRLIEIGCGCGHYAALLDRELPGRFDYTGTDINPAMIDHAQRLWPDKTWIVNDLLTNTIDLNEYDVVFAAGVVEVLPDYRQALDTLLAPPGPTVVLHRQTLTDKPTRIKTADTYGHPGFRVHLNRGELDTIIASHGREITAAFSGSQHTLVIRPAA